MLSVVAVVIDIVVDIVIIGIAVVVLLLVQGRRNCKGCKGFSFAPFDYKINERH